MTLPPLWLCADLSAAPASTLCDRVRRALTAGPAVVWLRAPETVTAKELLQVARALGALSRDAGGALLVGERGDVALAAEADGVHLPERAYAPSRVAHWPLRRSRAVHDVAGVRTHAASVDALVASPWGAVPGKGIPLGDKGLCALVGAAGETPVVALGGVATADDVRACVAAGARGVAVRRALVDATDPAAACAPLHAALAGLTVGRVPCDARGR